MFLPPIPRLAAWIVAGLVCWQWSSVYGESGRRNLAFQGHVGSIRVHRHVSFSPQDSSVELHRLHSLRYHLRRRSASERPTQRLAPPPPTLPEVLPPPTPPKKKPRGQNVPGLPKWYTWRSVTEGHQYGLDKDEVLREHAAPKLDCGIPAPKYKFYVYPLDIPERCNLDKKNLTSELFRSMGSHSQWLDEVFFYHQMLDHPWRTFDPSEAYLFYVPILTTLSSTGYCGDWKENMRQVQAALQASPWYHRYSGADHLMFATNKNIREYCADHPDFADMVKNFIVGRQLYWVSEFPDQCSIAVPHSSQMAAKGQCNYQRGKGSEEPNILYCESDLVKERDASFEAYKERRNYTMFCMGQADDRPTHTSRKTAIDNLSELRPPNYLLGVGVKPASKWRPDCQPGQVRSFGVSFSTHPCCARRLLLAKELTGVSCTFCNL